MATNPKMVTYNFLNEQNNLLLQIHTYLSKLQSERKYYENKEGLLTSLFDITRYMKDKRIKFNFSQQFGIAFFTDCFLMNPIIFSGFIHWPENVMKRIILTEDFSCTPLTQSQYIQLVLKKYIYGCIFDWKVLKYPNNQLSDRILDNIIQLGGPSFYLQTKDISEVLKEPKGQELKAIFVNLVDIPPDKDHQVPFNNKSYEKALLQFANDTKSPQKCWLLYKENK